MADEARLRALAAEARRLELVLAKRGFDIKAYANGHTRQLEVLQAARVERRMLLMMARQTGKSWSIAGAHADRAMSRPGVTNLAFGLTGPAVRNTFWEPVWLPMCARWKLPAEHVDTTMTTRWANGSRTLFSGTDDVRHVQNVLGGRLDGSLVSIDECQSQPRDVFVAMLRTILPPMLTPSSTLLLAGTIPEAPGGPWWVESQKTSWWQRSWGRMDNVHTPEARAELDAHMQANGLAELDPQIQRDWFGNREAFDPLARAYHYREERNGYAPARPAWVDRLQLKSGKAWGADPLPGVDTFSVALDPGGSDPCGVVILGWSSKTGGPVYELFDWVSEYNARLSLDDMADVVRQARDAIGGRNWQYRYDTNSDMEINAFQHSHGIPSIKAAKKADMAGQIRRANNMLGNATLKVIAGSNLAQDFVTARLDQGKLANNQWAWTNDYHPTASECARYALAGFWDAVPVSKPPVPADPFEAEMARARALENVPAYLRKRTANGWRM